MIDVKSFKDRNGARVNIGDKVSYWDHKRNQAHSQVRTVRRIMKSGYFIEVYVEEMTHPWHTPFIVKVLPTMGDKKDSTCIAP